MVLPESVRGATALPAPLARTPMVTWSEERVGEIEREGGISVNACFPATNTGYSLYQPMKYRPQKEWQNHNSIYGITSIIRLQSTTS